MRFGVIGVAAALAGAALLCLPSAGFAAAGPAGGHPRRARGARRVEPAAVRVGRRRPRRDRGAGRNAAVGRSGDARRRRRHLGVRAGSRGEPPARGRRRRPAARSERARGERSGAWEGEAEPRPGHARESRAERRAGDVLRAVAGRLQVHGREPARERRPHDDGNRAVVRDPDAGRVGLPRDVEHVATYTPGMPRPANMATTTTMDGQTVDFVVRWERGTINRFVYSIALLSPATQTATPDLSAWNGVLLDKFEGGVAIGHYQGNPQRDSMLYLNGLEARLRDRVLDRHRDRDALQPPARRRDRDHGQGPLRLGVRRAALHGRRRRLGRRDPAVRLRPEPSGPARRGDPAVLVPRHGHADDPRRRLRAARAVGRRERATLGPLSMWRDLGEPLADRGPERERRDAEPVRGR